MNCNAGILYFRASPGAKAFLGAWDGALRRGVANVTEQSAFNAVVRQGMRPLKTHPGNYRVFYGMDAKASFGVLPLPGFLNGHGYFVQRLHEVRSPARDKSSPLGYLNSIRSRKAPVRNVRTSEVSIMLLYCSTLVVIHNCHFTVQQGNVQPVSALPAKIA